MEMERSLRTLYIGLHGVIDWVVDLSINLVQNSLDVSTIQC